MNQKLRNAIIAGLLAAGAGVTAPAHANSEAMFELINVLRQNGTIDQATYESLMKVAREDAEQSEAQVKEVAQAEARKATKDTVRIKTKEKLAFESGDGMFRWNVFGRIMADYTAFNDDKSEFEDGTELRRLRLGFGGTLWKVWNFKIQPDFAKGSVTMKDAWIGYKGFAHTQIKVGNHHVPFGQDLLNSSKYMMFIERSLVANALQEHLADRRIGLSARHWGESYQAQAGIFGGPANGGADEFYNAAIRASFAPIHDKDKVLHLGAAYVHGFKGDAGSHMISLSSRPETHLGSKLVSTGSLEVDDYDLYGVEFAGVYGPATLLAEYNHASLSRPRGASDLDVDGWYVSGSWFLTGEHRNYKVKDGMFHSIHPHGVVGKGGIGAWEVAVRYSDVDLTDSGAGITGGEEQNVTVGLNWYPTKTIRFMANYVDVLNVDRPGSSHDGDEPSAFILRSQIYW